MYTNLTKQGKKMAQPNTFKIIDANDAIILDLPNDGSYDLEMILSVEDSFVECKNKQEAIDAIADVMKRAGFEEEEIKMYTSELNDSYDEEDGFVYSEMLDLHIDW